MCFVSFVVALCTCPNEFDSLRWDRRVEVLGARPLWLPRPASLSASRSDLTASGVCLQALAASHGIRSTRSVASPTLCLHAPSRRITQGQTRKSTLRTGTLLPKLARVLQQHADDIRAGVAKLEAGFLNESFRRHDPRIANEAPQRSGKAKDR